MSKQNENNKTSVITTNATLEKPAPLTERNLIGAIRTETAPEATSFFMFFVNNAKLLMVSLSIFIIVLIGFGIFEYTAKQTIEKSQKELSIILQKTDEKEKIKALESFITKAPAGTSISANLALAKSYENLQEHAKAANAWKAISELTDAPMKHQAAIGEASDLSAIGEYKKAIEVIQKSLATINMTDTTYQMTLKALLADVAERAGDKELAIKTIQELLNSGKVQDTYYFKRRIEILQAKK